MFEKLRCVESKKIRDSARGEVCTVRYPGVCRQCTETVVLAHENGGGIADKHSDERAAYACQSCHTLYDVPPHNLDLVAEAMADTGSRTLTECITRLYLEWRFLKGHMETLDRFRQKGLVVWK